MVPRVGNETLRPLGFGPCFGRKLQTKKLMMYSPGGPFIMVAPVVTSWAVAGQRMVFLHMYLQTRVTLKAFPVATPRGRSVSFPTRGTMVTYVTWDDLWFVLVSCSYRSLCWKCDKTVRCLAYLICYGISFGVFSLCLILVYANFQCAYILFFFIFINTTYLLFV